MQHGNHDSVPGSAFNWQVLKVLWPWLLEHRSRITLAFAFLLLAKLANIAGPFLLKFIVDELDVDAAGGAELVLLSPVALLLAYGLSRFTNVLFGELRDTVFGRVTERAMHRIGLQVFDHLHRLDLAFHLDRRTGALARDIERGTTGIGFLLRFFVFNILPTVIEIALVVVLMQVYYGWIFALIPLVSVAIYVVFSIVTTEWRTQFVREMNEADSSSNTRAIDSLINFETVKYFTNERFESQRYDRELDVWEQARRKNRLSMFALNGGQALIIAAAQTAMLIAAAIQVSERTLSVGDFVAIQAFMLQLFLPLNFLGFVYREIKGSMANIEKLFALLDVQPNVVERANAQPLQIARAAVAFENVSFGYGPERPILREISFRIEPGEKVAVVGASGAGKSTLVKLLFRFYDADSGRITIDDQNIRDCTLQSLREAVSIVPQDTVLFNDSLLENIRYGRPTASDDEVREAIRLAHLQGFIAQLPKGEQTLVGERGLKLSGGEKQRVAIARTILKRAPILVFDEATSSLDSQSEQAILGALREVASGHSSLVIAHRLSTIIDADRILVLHEGRLVEAGSHSQLLAAGGRYAALWQAQQQRPESAAAVRG